nr:class I SAM-dependent DNA methyltransferase [Gemmatimonadota bacterium]
ANDGGHLLLDATQKDDLIRAEPAARRYIRPYYGPDEFINGQERFCLWLVGVAPNELRSMPRVMERVESVREERLQSKRPTTKELARVPALFGEIRQPSTRYLGIPKTSSESRAYIPMAFLEATDIAGSDIFTVPGAGLWHFGVLTSGMHMAWVRYVCGRLKSDFRYSAGIAYNNFPWPEETTPARQRAVENAAAAVLSARARFPAASLADLYDPIAMPRELAAAHALVDRTVERCYRKELFKNDRVRVELLFQLYEMLTAPLMPALSTSSAKPKKRKART